MENSSSKVRFDIDTYNLLAIGQHKQQRRFKMEELPLSVQKKRHS